MRCHTCTSQGAWCPEASRTQISCVGQQDQCVDLDITGKLGPYSNLKLKGCTNLPRCEETLSFHSGSRTIHASCCNTPFCNTFTPAGKEVSLVTFKGCASPAMCQSSLLELVQELEDADIICCQGNLCNNRIVDGVVTEPKVPADSPENMEDVECPVFNPTPAELIPKSDCFYSDEVEDGNVVVNPPSSEVPSPRNHTDKETVYMADEKKVSENFVNESNARPSSPHDHTLVGGKTFEESLSGNSSESSESSSSTGGSQPEHGSSGSSSATTNLETHNSTSYDSHGSVALLIPFIVPNRDRTTSPPTSSPITTSPSKEVLTADSNDKDVASDKCETEGECLATGGHFIATKEKDHEGSPSRHPPSSPYGSGNPVNISSSAEDTPSAGNFLREGSNQESGSYSSSTENTHNVSVLAVEEHGLPHSPATNASESTNIEHGHGSTGGESFIVDNSIPVSTPASRNATSDGLASHVLPILPIDNSSFIVEDKTKANASSAANTNLFANNTNIQTYLNTNMSKSTTNLGMGLVAALSTSHPQTKTPCKHPECQNPPKVNLMASSGAEEEATRNASSSFLTDPKRPERKTGGKERPGSGALSLTFNFGLFSFILGLAALT
ncbi:hypothetical protein Chor_005286 [Crotalus horridus]